VAIAWAKQAELMLKRNFHRLTFLPDTAITNVKGLISFFYHHYLPKILFTFMCLAANHMMSSFACDRCLNGTSNFG